MDKVGGKGDHLKTRWVQTTGVGLDLIQMPIFSIISQASSEAQLICLHTVGFFSTATPMPVSCLAAKI